MADWPEVLPRYVHSHQSSTDIRLIERTDILKREVEDLRALVGKCPLLAPQTECDDNSCPQFTTKGEV